MRFNKNKVTINWKKLEELVKNNRYVISKEKKETIWKHPESGAINLLNKMLAQNELPCDETCGGQIMKWCKLEDAQRLFEVLKATPASVCGLWSFTAIIHHYCSAEKFELQEKLYQECQQKIGADKVNSDRFLIGDMLEVYAKCRKYNQAYAIYKKLKALNNEPSDITAIDDQFDRISCYFLEKENGFSTELNSIFSDRLKARVKDTLENPQNYKGRDANKHKRMHYDLLIQFCFITKDEISALKLFHKAVHVEKIFDNNVINFKKTKDKVTLDFHLSERYKEQEGGISLPAAKIAVLYFILQYVDAGDHLDVVMIPGGNRHNTATLLKEIPEFLGERFALKETDIKKPDDRRICMFTVPYEAWRSSVVYTQQTKGAISELAQLTASSKTAEEFKEETKSKSTQSSANCAASLLSHLRKYKEPHKKFSKELAIPAAELTTEIEKMIQQADAFFRRRELNKECLCYEELLKKTSAVWLYTKYGWCLTQRQKFDDAIVQYTKAIELYETFKTNSTQQAKNNEEWVSEAFRKRGWTCFKKYLIHRNEDDFKKAMLDCEHALKINPNNFEVYNNLGIMLKEAGKDLKKAEEYFQILQKMQPDHYECCVHLGDIYSQQKQYDQAGLAYAEAIKRNSKSAWVFCRQGCSLAQQYQEEFKRTGSVSSDLQSIWQEAKEAFEKSLKLSEVANPASKELSKLIEEAAAISNSKCKTF